MVATHSLITAQPVIREKSIRISKFLLYIAFPSLVFCLTNSSHLNLPKLISPPHKLTKCASLAESPPPCSVIQKLQKACVITVIVSIIFLLSDIRVLGCLLPRVQDSCFMFSSIILEIDSNKTKSLTCQSLIQIATITISLIVLTVRKAGKTSFYFRHSCAQTET